MKLYPDNPAFDCRFITGLERFENQGYHYKLGAAIAGDSFMHAGRRFYLNYHNMRSQKPIYTYRFGQASRQERAIDYDCATCFRYALLRVTSALWDLFMLQNCRYPTENDLV
jgi:hypothetical protein